MNIAKFTNKYYDMVNSIYEDAFPKYERYLPLDKMVATNNCELYCLIDNDMVCGFIYTMIHKNSVYVLYLAVGFKHRDKGYGSQLLKWCINNYKGSNIFLNIDEVNPQKPDYTKRKNRLKFYLKNGFHLINIISSDEYENFHVLSTKKNVDLQEYTELDNYVTRVLEMEPSIITMIKLPYVLENDAKNLK